MGLFISVQVRNELLPETEARRHLARVCPVDIFALEGDEVTVRAKNEDECTLCELCLQAAPPGAVTIRKRYAQEQEPQDKVQGSPDPP